MMFCFSAAKDRGALAVSLLVITLSGCAQYSEPLPNSATAELTVESGLGPNFTAHAYRAYGDEGCSPAPGSGHIAIFSWANKAPAKSVRVAASQRIFITGRFESPTGVMWTRQDAALAEKNANTEEGRQEHERGGGALITFGHDYCTAVVSFVPLQGHRYKARQSFADSACPMTIIDLATGQAAEGLQRHRVLKACSLSAS